MKSVAEELTDPLIPIFNMSIESGSIPKAWKQSNVSPIHKGGSDDPGNFRPIPVVPIIAKVLEKLIANQLLMILKHTVYSMTIKEHIAVADLQIKSLCILLT